MFFLTNVYLMTIKTTATMIDMPCVDVVLLSYSTTAVLWFAVFLTNVQLRMMMIMIRNTPRLLLNC